MVRSTARQTRVSKKSLVLVMLLIFGASIGVRSVVGGSAPVGTSVVTFAPSDENMANPERGFAFQNDVPFPADAAKWGFCDQGKNFETYDYVARNTPLTVELLNSKRALGMSIIMSRYHIAEFRNSSISVDYLQFLEHDFSVLRATGFKTSIKFVYNYPSGGPDASLERVLGHLDDLAPLFERNKDVIAYMEAGFVGCWGEWIHSSNNLNKPEDGPITEPERKILTKILQVLPKERMVAVRFPRHVFTYFGGEVTKPIQPLSATTAFDQTDRSRVGHEENCFVCSDTNGSTYALDPDNLVRPFLAANNEFVVQEGESGDPESIFPNEPPNPKSRLSECARVETELRSLHWSVLGLFNMESPANVIKRWQRDGCLENFKRKLGYRFRLTKATIPKSSSSGSTMKLGLTMANDGWARPYNGRAVELVLRMRKTKADTHIAITPPVDARLWLPGPGETKELVLNIAVPKLSAGTYDVFLNLPAPEPSIRKKATFSIQLANVGTWEPATGFNSLKASIDIR